VHLPVSNTAKHFQLTRLDQPARLSGGAERQPHKRQSIFFHGLFIDKAITQDRVQIRGPLVFSVRSQRI
jgi:hypothetical protein